MKNLNKYKAAMSRKKVQSNPLEEIMRPPEAEIDLDSPEPPLPKMIPDPSAPPLPPKRPQNSPAVRDERMRRKGRFPTATELHAKYHANLGGAGMWLVEATVWTDQTGPSDGNAGKTFSQSGPGIHGCIESLWDQYCRWRDEQKEAAK